MNRQELVKELDALQDKFKIQQKYGRSVQPDSGLPNGPAALRAAEERLAARLPASRAERALEEITHGQAMWQKFQEQAEADEKSRELHGPNGVAQRKDGLDMSLQQLMSDASRMRSQLNEIGLQLGRGGREKALEHLKHAVPRDLREEFREQQKVLLEQKRVLDQLRHERLAAEGDQYWLHRKNRLDHADNVVGKPGVDPAVPPEELLEAHQRMRANPMDERMYGWSDPQVAVPPQDGYVSAEILQVSRRQQPGTVAELCIIDKAGVTLARSIADFPDEVGERCMMTVAIPESIAAGSATAEVSLLGPSWQNSLRITVSELSAGGRPEEYSMDGEKPLTAKMILSCVKPQNDQGQRLQARRVVENPSICPHSDLPGSYPELPPSDAHRRSLKAAWHRQGRPDYLHGVDDSYSLAADHDRRARAVAMRKRAPIRAKEEPAAAALGPSGPSSTSPRSEQPVTGGFFSGWEEPEPLEDTESRASGSSRWRRDTDRSPITGANPIRESYWAYEDGLEESQADGSRNSHGFAERGPPEEPARRPLHDQLGEENVVMTPGFGTGFPYGKKGIRSLGSEEQTTPRGRSQSKKKAMPRPYFEAEPDEKPSDWVLPEFPFAAFAGFGSSEPDLKDQVAEEPVAEEEEESVPSSFFASLAMPFVAFAGFGEEPATPPKPPAPPAPKKPQAKPKPPASKVKVTKQSKKTAEEELKAMTEVEWQPWATYAADQEDPVENLDSVVLPLRPPHSSRNLDQLYSKLLQRQKDGKLGQRNVGQDVLELAARVAKLETLAPNLQQHNEEEEEGAKKMMTAYAALLLDSLQQYEDSSVLGLWIVEALTTLHRAGDADQQAEFSVPFFRAFVGVALRFQQANYPNLHMRVLQGLAEVGSPDCRLCDPGLLDYVLDQLDQNRNKLNTLTTEHALAILCMLRSPIRVGEQIRHCLLVLRGLKSEQHLCTRAMVTTAELYSVVDKLVDKERATREQGGYYASVFDEDAQTAFVADLGVPQSGVDIRLVATVMDLYPTNRKLAGAAVRTFAAMGKITGKHLQDIVSGEVRPISNALHEHARSRSVNLHVAELIHLMAQQRPDLVSEGLIIIACKSLRSSTRDAEIATHLLQSLEVFLKASPKGKGTAGPTNLSLAQALPFDVLVKIGETHFANSEVIRPLCSCIDLQATSSKDYRDDFVNAGTVAIPLRVFDQAEVHSPEACASSAALLKELLIESRKAASQFMDAGGPRLILNVLSKQSDNAAVVHHALSALAVAAQFVPVRRAMVHPELPHTLTFFDQIFRLAEAHVGTIPDILCWACLAAGALSECEHEESQEIMRKAMNMDLVQAMLTKIHSNFYSQVDMVFCQELISIAAKSNLSDRNILAATGEMLKMPARRKDLAEPPKSFHEETVTVVPTPSKVQGDWHEPLDIFAPLRRLGVGASPDEFGAAITQEQIAVLQGVASAPVKATVASQFMKAVKEEFLDGHKGSVEVFMNRRGPPEEGDDGELYEGGYILTTDEQRSLRPFIQRMRDAPDKEKEYKEIEHRWNVKAAEEPEEQGGFFTSVFGDGDARNPEAKAKAPAPVAPPNAQASQPNPPKAAGKAKAKPTQDEDESD